MSGSSVFLCVTATTLAAVFVTLCAFQISAVSMEHKRRRRSRPLEGPVPGRQCLSSIGLNNETGNGDASSTGVQNQQATAYEQTPTDGNRKQQSKTRSASSSQALSEEAKLNSLQTIRARSAALQTDNQTGKSTAPKPVTPARTAPAQRQGTHGSAVREQAGSAPQEARSEPERPEKADSTRPSSGPATDTPAPSLPQKASTSKRAKRGSSQPEPIEATPPGSDQPADTLAGPGSPELPDMLPSSSSAGPGNPEGGIPDIFAGLNEAEVEVSDLTDELNDIDGGGLPTPPPPKTPQKSKR